MKKFVVFGDGLYAASVVKLIRDRGGEVMCFRLQGNMGGSMASVFNNKYDYPLYGPHYLHTNNPEVADLCTSTCEFIEALEPTKSLVKTINGFKLIGGSLNYQSYRELFDLTTYSTSTIGYMARKSGSVDTEHLSDTEKILIDAYGLPMYDMVVKNQTEKTWMRPISEVPSSVVSRINSDTGFDEYKNTRKYNLYPKYGWCQFFQSILHDAIVVDKSELIRLVNTIKADPDIEVIWSLPPSLLYDGKRPQYLTRRFDYVNAHGSTLTQMKDGCSIYRCDDPDIIRTIILDRTPANMYWGVKPSEYIPILNEYPKMAEDTDMFLYPDPSPENKELFKQMISSIKVQYPNVHFGGRLGKHAYKNMDGIIESAIDLINILI